MEVCYQLPVLPLDRPVPQHVLSRRGAISFSSSSALFGCPNPRQLSQVGTDTGPAGPPAWPPPAERQALLLVSAGSWWCWSGAARGGLAAELPLAPRSPGDQRGGPRAERPACLPGPAAGRAFPACCQTPPAVARTYSVLWVYGSLLVRLSLYHLL